MRVYFVCFLVVVVIVAVFFFCIQRYQSIDVFAGYSAVDINSIIMVYFLLPL